MNSEPDPKLLGARGEPIVRGSETIWEIVTEEDGFGFGLALVRIADEWNEPHFHEGTLEIYMVVWGQIEVRLANVTLDNRAIWRGFNTLVDPGHFLDIQHRQGHQTRASNGTHAWFHVLTFPPFDPADYHVLEADAA